MVRPRARLAVGVKVTFEFVHGGTMARFLPSCAERYLLTEKM
jgi:hypothetical protein